MRRLTFLLALCITLTSCRDMVEREADEKFALAESALHQGEWAAADESFHEAILLHPDRADAWIGRGMTLTRLGEEESARKHYEEALRLYRATPAEPFDLDSLRRQIMLLVLLDRREEAEVLVAEAAAMHPGHESIGELSALVKKISLEFQDMILVDDDKEPTPILNANDLTGSP